MELGDLGQATLQYYNHNALKYARRTLPRPDTQALQEFCRRLPPGGRILDAGCGAGRDLRYFKAQGFEAEGLDASEQLVQLASTHSGARVWTANLLLLSLPRESYDGIWANRSLIHLSTTGCQRAMATFFSALKPGGILLVSIDEGEGSSEDRTDDPTGPARTIHRYREDDFASLIRQSGFRPLAVGRSPAHPDRVAFLAERVGG